MGSKMKNVISKRRPRQNIIAMILKNAKKKGSSRSSFTSASTATGSDNPSFSRSDSGGGGGGSSYGYHGSKKGILRSAVELTRRSKRAGSRSRRGKSRGRVGRAAAFVKGQRVFYQSPKGIAKVTIVGIHHDAKLEAYYTIRMRDGKEKQTDGKHLTVIQEDVKNGNGNGGSRVGRSGSSPTMDHTTESSSEVEEIIIEEIDDDEEDEKEEQQAVRGADAYVEDEFGSSSDESEGDEEDESNFEVDQNAYLRSPDGSIVKVQILSQGENPKHPARYTVSLPDGSRRDNVKPSSLATLTDLTSKELSALMKERNKRQHTKNEARSRSRSKGRYSQSPVDAAAAEMAFSNGGRAIQMVVAKTEDGGTKTVPMYEAGRRVWYKNASGTKPATILDVHLDDLLEPYYSIRLEDGREKQTDNSHIVLEAGEEEGEGHGTLVEVSTQVEEDVDKVSDNRKKSLVEQHQNFLMEQLQNIQHRPDGTSESTERKANMTPKKHRNADVSDATKKLGPASMASFTSTDHAGTATKLAQPATFAIGDEVIYNSSNGEQLRTVILRRHRDKKDRPYYSVRVPEGKQKQVYGHRLQLYVSQDPDGLRSSLRSPHSVSPRGSNSCGRRSRSRSKSGRPGHSKNPQDVRRSESIDDSIMSNSSRRSRASRERAAAGREESLESARGGRLQEPPSPREGQRDRFLSVRRGRSAVGQPSSHQHQFSSANHQHAIDTAPWSPRSSRPEHHSLNLGVIDDGEERQDQSKGKSISKLKRFRKSFQGRSKRE